MSNQSHAEWQLFKSWILQSYDWKTIKHDFQLETSVYIQNLMFQVALIESKSRNKKYSGKSFSLKSRWCLAKKHS